jgi:inorganic pyrophosphatase
MRNAVVEIPRGSFLKWRSDGTLDFVSVVPSPFNYGCLPDTMSGDGDPTDVILLGPRLPRGSRIRLPERGRVHFVDAGEEDPKLVLSVEPISPRQRRQLERFFRLYTLVKRVLNWLRRRRGVTVFLGVEVLADE